PMLGRWNSTRACETARGLASRYGASCGDVAACGSPTATTRGTNQMRRRVRTLPRWMRIALGSWLTPVIHCLPYLNQTSPLIRLEETSGRTVQQTYSLAFP